MKKKDKASLVHMSLDEAKKELLTLMKKKEMLRLDRFTKEQHNTREGREIRKKIAVMQTFMRQKELSV